MPVVVINPVLIVPGGSASEEDLNCLRAAIPGLQAWLQAQGVLLLLLDPKTPMISRGWDWFRQHPGGGPFFGAQALAIERNWRGPDADWRVLCFLRGYAPHSGEAGVTVGVVGYDALDNLQAGALLEQRDAACGLICHELGHLIGYHHISEPGDVMSEIAFWQNWPAITLRRQGPPPPAIPPPLEDQNSDG
jgi:hypothetical protein